jgi:putative MATE family efflux protein
MDTGSTVGAAGLGEKHPGFDRDWTRGSITGNLIKLAWPLIVSSILNMLGPTIDMIWVGSLGSDSIAGVGVAGIAIGLVMSAIMGLSMGMRAMIARFIGAHDPESANHVALQAFVLSAVVSLIVAMIGLFYTESIIRLFPLEEGVILEGTIYLRIVFLSAVVMIVRMMCESAIQSAGDAITPMWISVVFRLFHVALCPFMVLGWWIFPQLGVSGAAITNIISQTIGLGLSLWVLIAGRSIYFDRAGKRFRMGLGRMKLKTKHFRFDPGVIWRIFRIGIPASIMSMQQAFGAFFLVRIMGPFGTFAVAAHTITSRVEMIIFMPIVGLGMAAGILAGQNLGAEQPDRAEKSGWRAVFMALAFMSVCCLTLLFGAEGIVGIFNREPELLDMGGTFLRIGAVGYILIGFVIVMQFCISGAGDTVPPMILSLVMVWVFQIPLAYLMPDITGLGILGVRWAIVISIAVSSIAYTIYFKLGRWKRKRV